MVMVPTARARARQGERGQRKSTPRRLAVVATERVKETVDSTPLGSPTQAGSRPLFLGVKLGADLATIAVAMVVAFELRGVLHGRESSPSAMAHLVLGATSLPLWAAAFWHRQLYSEPHTASRLDEFRRLVNATLTSVGLVAITGVVLGTRVSRAWLLLTIPVVIALVEVEREAGKRLVSRVRVRGGFLRPVVVVGGNAEAFALCTMLKDTPALGYRPVGFVDDLAPLGAHLLPGLAVLGRLADTADVVRRTGARGVILATTAVELATSNRITRELNEAGISVELSSSLCDIAAGRLVVRPLGRFPVVYVAPAPRHGWRSRAKRVFDIAASLLLGLVVLPILALAALAVRLDSAGPILFRQKRVGKDGRIFEVLKFRTMVANAEELVQELRQRNEADGPLFKLRRDPRVTRVGRILRTLSIDEFPQLWNVVRNEMSLVGPRPALPAEVDLWTPELHHRLAVQPGMTGMWQVSSDRWRSFDDYARLDLYYVDNWSIWTDLAILVKTPFAVLFQASSPQS
jgi:exopolysaccharide biosynthesis polyprenyl glycosylphosphotransferase